MDGPSGITVAKENQSSETQSTFNRHLSIEINQPVSSMSISPAGRDVVLGARKGLFIIDLERPWDVPRFLPHLTSWEVADIQWNPHPARSRWVASTSNQKLLVWNLERSTSPRTAMSPQQPVATSYDFSHPSRPSLTTTAGLSQGFGIGVDNKGCPSLEVSTQSSFHRHGDELPASIHAPGPEAISRGSAIELVLHAHSRAITDINWSAFHPDILASCSIDTWVWVWDLRAPGKPAQGYSAWNSAMTQVKWNRASPHRLATSCDNKVLIWDDRKGSLPLANIEAHQSKIYGIDWSRDQTLGTDRLVTCSLDSTVKYWDLSSPSAQQAIGDRSLVTEAEMTIETATPVWRARHLPFGQGVMTLPQRSDTTLSMWSKESPGAPVARFEGHTDIVKEYLFRTKGGNDRSDDNRRFQLVTWSKDQTLRLWPVTQEQMKAVGHVPGAPMQVLHTRANAPNISYRSPPEPQPSPNPSSAGTPALVTSILPPASATRSLLSGKSQGSYGRLSSSPYGSNYATLEERVRENQPPSIHSRISASSSPSLQPSAALSRSQGKNQAPLAWERQRKGTELLAAPSATMTSPVSQILPQGLQSLDVAGSRSARHQSRRSAASNKATTSAAPRKAGVGGFMTRGTASTKWSVGAGRNGRRAAMGGDVDTVGWIAGIRMGGATGVTTAQNRNQQVSSQQQGNTEGQHVPAGQSAPGSQESDSAAQNLGEEITALNISHPHITFETVEISRRRLVVTLRGPWGDSSTATTHVFVRITFRFPTEYPKTALRFNLQRTSAIPLKRRAFLLRHLTALSTSCATNGVPGLEPCISLLEGRSMQPEVPTTPADQLPEHFKTPTATDVTFFPALPESDDEDLFPLPQFQWAAISCGARFGGDGTLITFCNPYTSTAPPSIASSRTGSRSGSTMLGGPGSLAMSSLASVTPLHPAVAPLTPQSGGRGTRSSGRSRHRRDVSLARPVHGPAHPRVGASSRSERGARTGSRFLRSYSALATAMDQLARRDTTKGGSTHGVLDSDVLSLMQSGFVQRRINRSESRGPISSLDSSRRRGGASLSHSEAGSSGPSSEAGDVPSKRSVVKNEAAIAEGGHELLAQHFGVETDQDTSEADAGAETETDIEAPSLPSQRGRSKPSRAPRTVPRLVTLHPHALRNAT